MRRPASRYGKSKVIVVHGVRERTLDPGQGRMVAIGAGSRRENDDRRAAGPT
jgi:hypothetical protein